MKFPTGGTVRDPRSVWLTRCDSGTNGIVRMEEDARSSSHDMLQRLEDIFQAVHIS